ncbi:MAG TPA: STAS-like domain-containing protein [Candidatus Omnitrophota bacterium]|jgi:hypothetical protein|nr:STAS-like domain-containing protein [Candidatus Omnitrophota bacterium]
MQVIKVNEVFKGEKCISGKATGSFFRNEVEIALAKNPVIIDFEGIEVITQSFSDEFLGPIFSHEGQDVLRTLKFKDCSEEVQAVILSTAHRFLSDRKAVS